LFIFLSTLSVHQEKDAPEIGTARSYFQAARPAAKPIPFFKDRCVPIFVRPVLTCWLLQPGNTKMFLDPYQTMIYSWLTRKLLRSNCVQRFAACRRWRFTAQTFNEALKFIYLQNCPTKHETATFGKVLLCAGNFILLQF
jgi:hypothetical protein